MPTGYTATLYEGKQEQTFEEFLFGCARAFVMRDEPGDAPIPDEFKADVGHYDRAIARARDDLRRLDTITVPNAQVAADVEYENRVTSRESDRQRRRAIRERYEAMLEHARAWEPPTPDHIGLKEFMISQLEESIAFECDYDPGAPQRQTAREWVDEQRKHAEESLTYHVKQREKEIERTTSRNAWVKALRESVA